MYKPQTTIRRLAEEFQDKWNYDKSSLFYPGNRDACIHELERLLAEYEIEIVAELRKKGLAL